jgi:DNA-binding LytR/AlgR family response regulator
MILKLNYDDRLMVIHKKTVNIIRISQITHLKASGEYSTIYTIDGPEVVTSRSLNEWEKRLPEQQFCRIHRAAIVNFDFIDKIDLRGKGTAELTIHGSSDRLGISRNYYRKMKIKYEL